MMRGKYLLLLSPWSFFPQTKKKIKEKCIKKKKRNKINSTDGSIVRKIDRDRGRQRVEN
jgi:hypothetical protein